MNPSVVVFFLHSTSWVVEWHHAYTIHRSLHASFFCQQRDSRIHLGVDILTHVRLQTELPWSKRHSASTAGGRPASGSRDHPSLFQSIGDADRLALGRPVSVAVSLFAVCWRFTAWLRDLLQIVAPLRYFRQDEDGTTPEIEYSECYDVLPSFPSDGVSAVGLRYAAIEFISRVPSPSDLSSG